MNDPQLPDSVRESSETPRRCDVQRQCAAERKIGEAMHAVEALGASEKLTDTIVHLNDARHSLADHVDEHPELLDGDETPSSIQKHAPKYRQDAWKDYTFAELAGWVHNLTIRAAARTDTQKRDKDLEDASNYLDMLRAKFESAKGSITAVIMLVIFIASAGNATAQVPPNIAIQVAPAAAAAASAQLREAHARLIQQRQQQATTPLQQANVRLWQPKQVMVPQDYNVQQYRVDQIRRTGILGLGVLPYYRTYSNTLQVWNPVPTNKQGSNGYQLPPRSTLNPRPSVLPERQLQYREPESQPEQPDVPSRSFGLQQWRLVPHIPRVGEVRYELQPVHPVHDRDGDRFTNGRQGEYVYRASDRSGI